MNSFQIDSATVDIARSIVSTPTGEHRLEPKPMAVLACLIDNAQQVVERDVLIDRVWPQVLVSDHALTRCISQLRTALGDTSKPPAIIETLPKRGYRLAPVAKPLASVRAHPHTSDHAVAVLPFKNLSSVQDNDYLAAGITRDLAERLSLIPGLRTVASTSTERYESLVDKADVAAELNARYLVRGDIEPRGPRIRVRIELIDASTQRQLWAGRFDEKTNAMFELQDALVQRIARSLASELDLDVARNIEARGSFNLTAWEHMHLAEAARRNYNRESAEFIVASLRAALRAQPDNGVASALLAMQLSQNLVSGWIQDPAATATEAQSLISAARRQAPNDARVLMAAGIAALMRGRHAESAVLLERSLAQNPNEPHTLAELGMVRFFETRELQPSIAMIEEAEAAAPHHPRFSIWAYRRGICYYEAGDSERAIAAYDEAIARTPGYHHTYLTKAVAQLWANDAAGARRSIRQGLSHNPNTTEERYVTGVRTFGLSLPDDLRGQFAALWP